MTGGGFKLSSAGEIVQEQWQWIAKQYPYVAPDEFVVMPNHVHGITIIDLPVDNPPAKGDVGAARERPVLVPDAALDAAPFHRKVKTLSELIGAFKTTSAKRIHDAGLNHSNGSDLSTSELFVVNKKRIASGNTFRPIH